MFNGRKAVRNGEGREPLGDVNVAWEAVKKIHLSQMYAYH
jgi:hypothetical protein